MPRQAIQWELSRATRESRDGQGKTDGHHQTRSEGHGHYLGRCRRTGDRQSRMASTCGPMLPSGCRMNLV